MATLPGTIHAGNLETSPRLQATLAVLDDGAEHSTLDLLLHTRSCAVHSDIAALRANGIRIAHTRKGRIHYYRLAEREESGQPSAFSL